MCGCMTWMSWNGVVLERRCPVLPVPEVRLYVCKQGCSVSAGKAILCSFAAGECVKALLALASALMTAEKSGGGILKGLVAIMT